MTAAELLRGLDKAATAGPWVARAVDHTGALWVCRADDRSSLWLADVRRYDRPERDNSVRNPNAHLIATTRNLLPLLAGLVEACEGLSEPGTLGIYAACVRVNEALAALNAAAAKEA